MRALHLLQSAGFSVVLNTARSLAHIREYCEAYGLPGGIAELGSVFWDATRQISIPLADPAAAEQCHCVRQTIQELPGVFVDPGNVASVRAYRYSGESTQALRDAEVREILRCGRCDGLYASQSATDTFFLPAGVGKGSALGKVREYLGCSLDPVVAMGDSDRDLDMLLSADFAYAPANASPDVRKLIRDGMCRQTKGALQAGFLEAARELCGGDNRDLKQFGNSNSLIDTLLGVPDRGKLERLCHGLRLRSGKGAA